MKENREIHFHVLKQCNQRLDILNTSVMCIEILISNIEYVVTSIFHEILSNLSD